VTFSHEQDIAMNAKNRKSTQPMTKDDPTLRQLPQRRAIFPCNQQGGSKAFQELPTCPRQLANLRTQRLHQIFLAMQLRDSSVLLEEFLKMVFSDENILDAYFFPKPIWDFMGADQPVGFPASGALPDWIPKDVASRSAAQAASMALIRPCERRVTQLATFLYPCAHFYYARNQALSGREGVILNLEQVETMRSLLLARPLHHLRTKAPSLGATLAAVLGLAVCDEDVSLTQVARISSAVYIANLKVSAIWGQS